MTSTVIIIHRKYSYFYKTLVDNNLLLYHEKNPFAIRHHFFDNIDYLKCLQEEIQKEWRIYRNKLHYVKQRYEIEKKKIMIITYKSILYKILCIDICNIIIEFIF